MSENQGSHEIIVESINSLNAIKLGINAKDVSYQ
jgi:hypothetical protein